jgi:alkylation response protein AidB-like acyl-CoA dehydrogenase
VTAARTFDDEAARSFREEYRAWLATSLPTSWQDVDPLLCSEEEETKIKCEWDQLLAGDNYRALAWPVEYGGRGLGPIEEVILAEEGAAARVPQELELIGKHLTGPALLAHGTERQRELYLRDIALARTMWCEGLSEPNAGSDLAAAVTGCRPAPGGYVVNGRKIWTSYAHQADHCFLLARSDPSRPRRKNMTVLLVDMSAPGVSVHPIQQVNGRHEFNEVVFEDVFVPEEDRVGAENEGWGIVTISGNRKMATVGQAPRRYIHLRQEMDQLTECARGRGYDQAVTDLDVGVELLRWHLRRLAELLVAGAEATRPASIVDLYWAELWQSMTDLALRVGCSDHDEYWQRRYFDSRPSTLYGGSAELKRNVIADHVLALPR